MQLDTVTNQGHLKYHSTNQGAKREHVTPAVFRKSYLQRS